MELLSTLLLKINWLWAFKLFHVKHNLQHCKIRPCQQHHNAKPAQLHAVEVWTRTMSNDTAQIFSFTLTTDSGEVLGPFTLDDAEQSYRFEVNAAADSLRLDVMESNGGNTGLIEFAAYGSPIE